MNEFINCHQDCITGVLHGFDRIIFRGTQRWISYPDGLARYLNMHRILLIHFKSHVLRMTKQLNAHIEGMARRLGRPCEYLRSPSISKQDVAERIAERDGIRSGLVCVLSCVEPCLSADLYRNRQSKKLELVMRRRQCKFYYVYLIDRQFGWMHIRIQSWLPFEVQVYINGRSYLQCELDRAGIGYEKRENCFTRIDNVDRAQRLMDKLKRGIRWAKVLRGIVRRWLTVKGQGLPDVGRYYWTIRQSEWATDVMFKDPASLAAIYPRLCRYAIEQLSSEDVLRFLGKKPSVRYGGQVAGAAMRLAEGVRVKHSVRSNSIKMSSVSSGTVVLRIETTINDPSMMRVYRRALNDPGSQLKWREMSKSVAEINRRARVCQDANARYLTALAPAIGHHQPSATVLDPASKPLRHEGKSYRALRPVAPDDAALFAAVMRGEHLINGFTNGAIQRALFDPEGPDVTQRRRCSSQIGRKLRLLRRHGLIHKLGRRRLYRVTQNGQRIMGLSLALRQSNANLLMAA